MAKTVLTAQSDLGDLVKNLLTIAEDFPVVIKVAAKEQMTYFSGAIKMNWSSMIPWGSNGDFVYDSIGYNVSWGNRTSNDVVGMAGVFKIDSVAAAHGKTKHDMTAPQLAYWAEFGTKNYTGVPFMSSAFYATMDAQDQVFADSLYAAINKELNK